MPTPPRARSATKRVARRKATRQTPRVGLAPSIAAALSGDTLVENFLRRDLKAVAFRLESIEAPAVEVSFGELLERARRTALGLAALGVERGDRVLLILPTSVEFVCGFWGILLAGATPVPAYPPAGLHQLETFTANLDRMIRVSRARLVVVPELLRDVLTQGEKRIEGSRLVLPEDVEGGAPANAALPAPPAAGDLALIQFSSGSTGDPRGVCLSHRNVLANIRSFLSRMNAGPEDSCATWLPLYHDMGLIGTLLGPLMAGRPVALLSPVDFLRRPALWLQMISRYGATISVAPQFAFNFCVRKIDPAALEGVDLSSLRVLLNGAEPIYADGVAAFQRTFRPFGLRPGVVTPCYGLAEATLAASMQVPGSKLRTHRPASGGGSPSKRNGDPSFVSVGRAMDGVELRVRGAEGESLPDGVEGEICVRGASVCEGILRDGAVTPITDAEGWLRTGDLGFLEDGELFVTGRLKDLIIVGGRNYYPQDLETVAAEIDGLRPGRVVALGVRHPERATEALVVVAETAEMEAPQGADMVKRLRQLFLRRFGIAPNDTLLVRRGQIPLTTSGKLRRSQARQMYEHDDFKEVVYRVR